MDDDPGDEMAERIGLALEQLTRSVPLGTPCPSCGSSATSHVSIGNPEGEVHVTPDGWRVVLPPGVFASYLSCEGCGEVWEADRA